MAVLSLSLLFSIMACPFGLPHGALAQIPPGAPKCNITTAINLPLVNSQGQDLCSIAHTAWGMCTGSWDWGTVLPMGFVYMRPSDGCQCAIVLYNLVSSCAWCQGGSWATWPDWSSSCAASQFSQIIPLNITVPYPNWAYTVPDSGTFNVSVAAAVGDQPESSTVPPPSSTSTVASSTTSSTLSSSSSVTHSSTSTSTSTSTSSPSSTAVTKKTTNAGPIAGGVAAGVVAIAAACGVLLWYMRRKKRATETHPSTSATPTLPPSTMSQKQYTYYDPDDPTTFPQSMDMTITSTYVGPPIRIYEPSPTQAGVAYSESPTRNGSYPGLPEVY
ncbi:hypothetical protein JAAARDRAFT_42434 [Jaapia argillacea MUCL 33604]|uniref:Transmembrane protein n=1 Tax=Jaapia argillacea MUCL 33604 TaxID=933084 RepID=A0A067PHN3_9AGAM|nr:hypothetical protein JAAARDRAFT_42434 [Jaapia argillacea MUCL 33604]